MFKCSIFQIPPIFDPMSPIRSRIAPTPSGFLHIGNALNFALTWLYTRKAGGSLRLRIDDLDEPHMRPEYVDDIFYTLDWLGLDWDEGSQNAEQQYNIYSRLHRLDRYNLLLKKLLETGQVFACTCSRRAQVDETTGHCVHYSQRVGVQSIELFNPAQTGVQDIEPLHYLRLATEKGLIITVPDMLNKPDEVNLFDTIKDPIMRRQDGLPAYHIASLADDIDFGINMIVRGEDLLSSTAIQLYMAELLKEDTFLECRFHHHPLMMDESGNKLSKSAGSTSIKYLREKGENSENFYRMLSKRIGLKEEAFSPKKILERM